MSVGDFGQRAMQNATEEICDHAIELDWFDAPDTVNITPRDLQRFKIQKDRAIRLLQLANDADEQLTLLLGRLGEWLRDHAESVEMAYLTLRDARFAFVIISSTPECNDDLEDAVSEFDIRVANDPDLNVVRMNAFVLPPASQEVLSSFLDPSFLIAYRGRRT